MSTTRSNRSSSSVTATRPATRSSSPTSKAKSSPSPPDPLPASATSATADAPEPAPGTRECHRSPDTPTVTDVRMQNCHPCPETSQRLVDHAFSGIEQGMLAAGELVLDAKRTVADAPESFAGGEFGQDLFLGAGQAEMPGGGAELVGFLAVDDAGGA